MKNPVKQVGITTDNRPAMNGVFFMYDSMGLPLCTLLDLFEQKNMQVCWYSFIKDAHRSGWKNETILSRLKEAINDSFGLTYWNNISERIVDIVNKL